MADLIKKIKIKKQDGTFTDYIPIGAEAQNISTSDGDSVQLKLNKKPYYYNSVADMQADTKLKVGDMAITLGYYTSGDNGGAEYEIVSSTNKYAETLNNNLKARLIIRDCLNVRQIGAKGDNVTDDTAKIQLAINTTRKVYIPSGQYVITASLTPRENNFIYGDGRSTYLRNAINGFDYVIKLTGGSTQYGLQLENLNFQAFTNHASTPAGGVYIEKAMRGNSFKNLWFNGLSNPIYLGNSVWANFMLENIFIYFFASTESWSAEDLASSVGLYGEGNTMYGTGIEIIGSFNKGMYLNTASVGNFTKLNISGSSGYPMNTGIFLNKCNDLNLDTCWIERLDTAGKEHLSLYEAVVVKESKNIGLNNMHCSSGCIYVDASTGIRVTGARYYTKDTGLRYMNNSEITCDTLESCGKMNYQDRQNMYGGYVTIEGYNDTGYANILQNPLSFTGLTSHFTASNGSLITLTWDTTHQLTGDRCLQCSSNNNYQGAKLRNVNTKAGQDYTLFAYVKAISNVQCIYFIQRGGGKVIQFPREAYYDLGTNDEGWHLIRCPFRANENALDMTIGAMKQDSEQSMTFLIDSVFLIEGVCQNLTVEKTKESMFKNSKMILPGPPTGGSIWTKGDIIYNDFSDSTNDTIEKWFYDGSSWVPVYLNISSESI